MKYPLLKSESTKCTELPKGARHKTKDGSEFKILISLFFCFSLIPFRKSQDCTFLLDMNNEGLTDPLRFFSQLLDERGLQTSPHQMLVLEITNCIPKMGRHK